MTSQSHITLLLLVFCAAAALAATSHGRVPMPQRYMPHSFLKVDTSRYDEWRATVNDAAQDAVKVINAHRAKRDQHYVLDALDFEGVRVGRALAFGGEVEVGHVDQRSNGASHTLTHHTGFRQLYPIDSLAPLWSLPSSSPSAGSATSTHGLLPALSQPQDVPAFPDIELEGPLVLHLGQQLYDPVLRLPHQVDAGSMRIIKVGPGVRLGLSGIHEIRLRSSFDVQHNWKMLALMNENATSSSPSSSSAATPPEMDVLELELKLSNNGQKFRLWSATGERAKVKRRSPNVVELVQVSSSTDLAQRHQHSDSQLVASAVKPFVVSPPNLLRSFVDAFNDAVQAGHEGQQIVLRRVVEAKAEAVQAITLPLTLRSPASGRTSSWQAVVTRGADGKNVVMSYHSLEGDDEADGDFHMNEVTVAPSILANTTMPNIMRAIHLLRSEPQQEEEESQVPQAAF